MYDMYDILDTKRRDLLCDREKFKAHCHRKLQSMVLHPILNKHETVNACKETNARRLTCTD